MIYTSGSTGRPKGVPISHASLANLIGWHQQAFALTSADRASMVAGLGFDASVWELWPYLATGASLHLVTDELRAAPEHLRDWLIAQAITIGFLPTPLAERMLALEWPATTTLRLLLTGGDTLQLAPPPTLPFTLVNNYGPTENTVVTTSGVVAPRSTSGLPPTIGRPIANTEVYLLDSHLRPVPIGVAGELYIGGVELELRSLFETPTIAGLAALIESARQSGAGPDTPPISPVARDGALPLSFAQQRLWFLDQLEPNSPFYNIPAAIRLGGALDLPALRASFSALIARHEALRTRFTAVEGVPVQVIGSAHPILLPVIDLHALAADQREEIVLRLAGAEAQRPFDLGGTLLRTTVLRLASDQHVLLLTMHHIISDGWSIGILIRELAALYTARRPGAPDPLPALAIQYADYAVWQR